MIMKLCMRNLHFFVSMYQLYLHNMTFLFLSQNIYRK